MDRNSSRDATKQESIMADDESYMGSAFKQKLWNASLKSMYLEVQ